MPSLVEIQPQIDAGVGAARNSRQLTQKVRGGGRDNQLFLFIAEAFDGFQMELDQIKRALRRAPAVGRIQIAGADILDLTVGGPDGPGQLEVLSGPPSYARVAWIGTENSGTTVNITSATGGSFTTSAPHNLEAGDIFYVEGITSVNHLGWHEVATTPTPTTLTVVTAPTGSGTGGTLERVYAGGHFRSIYLGGADASESPLFSTPAGQLIIGRNGSIILQDSFKDQKGYIGVTAPESAKGVSGTANNGGIVRLTVTAHGYESGDTVIAGTAGYAIAVIDANTIDLIGSVFGSFTPVSTVSRYFAGIWDEQHASGGTGYQDAPFRAKADGSIRVGDPTKPHFEVAADGSILIGESAGPRIEIDGSTGDMDVTDAVITLTKNGITTTIGNVADSGTGFAGLTVYDDTDPDGIEITKEAIYFVQSGGVASRIEPHLGGHWLVLAGSGGNAVYAAEALSLLSNQVVLTAGPNALIFSGTTVIDGSRNGFFNTVSFLDPATTRTNLDVYDKAYIDALEARIAALEGGGGGPFVSQATFDLHNHSYSGTDSGGDSYAGVTSAP